MPIVIPSYSTPIVEQSGLTLTEYAWHLGIGECGMWGVALPPDSDEVYGHFCSDIWSKEDRDILIRYLREAQDEIERITNFPLSPTYITGEISNCFRSPVMTKKHHVRAFGTKGQTLIEGEVTLDWSNTDYAELVHTWITDQPAVYEEIEIRHTGLDVVVVPSSIEIDTVAQTITVQIPRCRLVDPANADNPPEGWDYTDQDVFAETVDLWRVFTDTTNQGSFICRKPCTCNESLTTAACAYIRNGNQGVVEVLPATHYPCTCGATPQVSLNYLAGDPLTPEARETIIRLAHTKLPKEFCGCPTWEAKWAYDNQQPKFNTFERINCPFGLGQGAWVAYQWAMQMASVRLIPLHGSLA